MSHLPKYQYDIFISYASVDNLAMNENQEGWVKEFKKCLDICLTRRFGRFDAVKTWCGLEIIGNQVFNDTIKAAIEESKLFIALTSNGYLESDYCQKELRWFYQKAIKESIGLTLGDRSRIFNVLIDNIHYNNWPKEFAGTSGFLLHDADNKKQLGEPTEPGTPLFRKQLRKLVDAIYGLLTQFQKMFPEERLEEAIEKEEPGEKSKVFIADVSPSITQIKERVKNELTQENIQIVNDIPPSDELQEYEEHLIEKLRSVYLSIHLFDYLPGTKIKGEDEKTYPQKQAELAYKLRKNQFIWVPDSINIEKIEDENHRTFLQYLKNNDREKEMYEFIQMPSTSITKEVLKKIYQLKTSTKRKISEYNILLDTHLKDQQCAFQLGEYLAKKGIQPYINQETDNPLQNINLFEERLKQVSVLIIFYGLVAEEWVRERISTVQQFAAKEIINKRQCNLEACCVYLIPPKKSRKLIQTQFRIFQIHSIDNSECDIINPKSLAPLFENIGWEVEL